MKKAPYSLVEAKQICSDYQYLTGHSFEKNGDISINCIAISPFDQINKERFIMYYLLLNNAELALSMDFKGLLFDVMVIAGSQEEPQFRHEDIYTWLSKNKFTFEIDESEIMDHSSIFLACS
jgi:hypothetical protein